MPKMTCYFFPEAAYHYTVKYSEKIKIAQTKYTGTEMKALQTPHISCNSQGGVGYYRECNNGRKILFAPTLCEKIGSIQG